MERFPCMAANRVLHVLGCRDQIVQHAKPNQKVQAWGKCFSGLDGRQWVALALYPSLAEPHPEEPFCLLQRAMQSVDGVSIPLCPLLAHLPCFWSGSADVPSFIPWSPCLLMSLAKALHCIWSDCNSWILVAWANQTQFPAIQSPALLPNEGYFPAKLHLSNHSQFSCRKLPRKKGQKDFFIIFFIFKKDFLLFPVFKRSSPNSSKTFKTREKSLQGRCWL